MQYKTWKQFYEDSIDENTQYFWRILDDTDEEHINAFFNCVNFNEQHILSRHYFEDENELLNRVCCAPPLLGIRKPFSMFDKTSDIIDNIEESIIASGTEIVKWLTYEKHQSEDIGCIDVEKNEKAGITLILDDSYHLNKYECNHFNFIIERDKSGTPENINNPFHFKVITMYPNLSDAEWVEDKTLQYDFADRLKNICDSNIVMKLAWGLHLQGELINIRNEDLQNESSKTIVEGVIPIENISPEEKYYSVRTSERGNVTVSLVDLVAKRETIIEVPDAEVSKAAKKISKKTLNAWKNIDYIINNEVLGIGQYRATDKYIPPTVSDINDSIDNVKNYEDR